MQIKPHHPEDFTQLRQQSRQQRDAKQRDRYRAILLALEGQSAPAIAQTLARSRRFVQIWVYMYRDHGLEAIHPKRQPGRPSKLPATKEGPFKERFLAGPTQADGVCRLCGRRMPSGSSKRNSGSSIRCQASMICCIAWAFPAWPRDHQALHPSATKTKHTIPGLLLGFVRRGPDDPHNGRLGFFR